MIRSLLGFAFSLGALVSPILAASDVVGGYNATVEEYPYIAFLVFTRAGGELSQCTGSAIGPRTILTAAHCTANTIAGRVRIGSSFSRSGGRQIETTGFANHPRYDPNKFHFDIAVLYTEEDLEIDGEPYPKALLPTSDDSIQAGQAVNVAGWGRTVANKSGGAQQLQQTLEQVQDHDICRSKWEPTKHAPIERSQVCLTTENFYKGSTLCQGDSGGPWTDPSKRYVLAVTSFGTDPCSTDERPNVGISTYETINFIMNHIE